MATWRRNVQVLLSLLVLLAVVAGCAAPAATPGVPATAVPPTKALAKDTLIYAQGQNPINLDPTLQESIGDYNIYCELYDSLLFRDDKGEFQPLLAESWAGVDDKTWEIKLRKGVKFHNGEPFTSASVKAAYDRILDPKNASQVLPWNTQVDKVTIVDDFTVRVSMKVAVPKSLIAFSLSRLWPVPAKVLAEKGDKTLITNPVGTGPYKFVQWVKDEYIQLERNEDYWGPKPAFKTIKFRIIPDAVTRAAALLTGEVDIISSLALTEVANVKKSDKVSVKTSPGGRAAMIQFNLLPDESPNKALMDKRVRQALAMAIDVNKDVAPLLEGFAIPLGTMVCPLCFGYDPAYKDPIPYDLAKAKQLLADAGYPNGFKMTLASSNGSYPMDKQTAEAVAGAWAKIGVECVVQPMEPTAFLDGWKKHTLKVDAYNQNLMSQGWDADDMLRRRFSKGEQMAYWYTDETVSLLKQGQTTVDDAGRKAIYSKVQAIVREEVPVISLFLRTSAFGVSNAVDYAPRADEWPYLQFAKPK